MIEHLALLPYRLPMTHPWESARATLRERKGWLVRAHCDGLRGYGDCAPLPEAGTEDHDTALAALSLWQSRAVGRPLDAVLHGIAADASAAPAARHAVECALADVASQRAGIPLRRWLAPAAADSVEVNAALGALREVTPQRLQDAIHVGFRTLKVKVGLDAPDVELRRLRELAGQLPAGIAFRLDANGAWDLEQARRMVGALDALPIESLEEPLREPRVADLQRLQAAAAFPLALDETLCRAGAAIALETLPVRRIVLKPAAVGSLRGTLALALRAIGRDLEVVVTSLVETAAGIWPTLQLAAATASPLAHGLASSGWLAKDVGAPPTVVGGRIALSGRPGGGFSAAQGTDDEPGPGNRRGVRAAQ